MAGIGDFVTGLVGTLFGGKRRLARQQQHMADAIHPVDATLAISPEIQQQLGLHQQLFNSAAPGENQQRQDIFTNQANTLNNVDNNATSGAQSLALGAATQGATNKALAGLQTEAEQSKINQEAGLDAAQNNMAQQEQEVYKDKVRKFNNDTAAKAALQSAAIQNKMSWNNDLARTIGSGVGAAAGFMTGGLFNGGTQGLPQMDNPPIPTIQAQPNYGGLMGRSTPTIYG